MRDEKQLLLDEVSERITGDSSWLITRYQNLTASVATDFRHRLREQGCDFEVVRKRLLLKAAESAGVSLDLKLEGHIGLVVAGDDPVAVSKVVFDFAKETKSVEVLAGHIDGVLVPASDVEKLSKLPSLPVLRAELLGLFEAPMSQTLAAMEALLTSVPHLLQNKVND